MAVIGKIREKSWLLVIVVGVAMLAFVLTDLGNLGGGSMEDNIGIGTVNGEKVKEEQYNTFVNNARNNMLQNKLQQNPGEQPRLTKADQESAAKQAWQTAILINLMGKEYKKIGLKVDDYELDNVLYGDNGFTPSSLSMQFLDSVTGQFAPDQLRKALEQLQDSGDPQSVQQYHDVLDFIRQERLESKYITLASSGIHTTTLEGKSEYNAQKTVKNVTYAYKSFTKVPNNAVGEVSDEEIQAYYDSHKNEEIYQQKASKKIAYFEVPIAPSQDDTLNALEYLKRLSDNFAKTKDDSIFVMRYSDVKNFRSGAAGIVKPEGTPTQGATYPMSIDAEVKAANKGDVIGPYIAKDGVKLSKLIGHADERTATVRHILLNATSPEDVAAAQKKADSIVSVIRSKHNFEEMVQEFSEDPGSKNTGGKYENFTEGTMVPEFNDFSFEKPIGTLGTVKTSYGIHIVEVLDRESVNFPVLATITKDVSPTKSTADAINGMTSNYIYELDDLFFEKNPEEIVEIFDTFVVNKGYNVRTAVVLDEDPKISGFTDVAEGRVFKLIYEDGAKVGDISSSPIHDGERFVVAIITDIVAEGTPELSVVKDRMKAEVLKEKQAQYLIDEMLGRTDIEAMAAETGAQLQTEGLTFSASNVAVGSEPAIVGTAFSGLLDGETSVPVKGKNGVFVLRVDQTTLGEETTDYSSEIEQLETQHVNSFKSQFQGALIKAADIKDNRKLRSYGIR